MPFGGTSVEVDAAQWLTANPNMTFTAWKEKASQKLSHIKSLNKQETHDYRLMEKYGLKWKQKTQKGNKNIMNIIIFFFIICSFFCKISTAAFHMVATHAVQIIFTFYSPLCLCYGDLPLCW